jgi:hypothetical protein
MNGNGNKALDGLQQIRAMVESGRGAPMVEKLGVKLAEVERGHAVFVGTPDRSVYNPLGVVHGGYAATLLDSACGIAVHTGFSCWTGDRPRGRDDLAVLPGQNRRLWRGRARQSAPAWARTTTTRRTRSGRCC